MENIQLEYQGTGNERIDVFLSKQFPYSRNFFHHIIERGGVSINNKAAKKSLKLKNWDKITIDDLERYLSPIILEESPDIEIPILKEEDDYLVINKPKGVLSHPNSIRDISQPNVVWFLYHHYKNLPSIGNFIRAGILHRLDKDTDGLMIIAKTEKGLSHFKNLFMEKSSKDTIEEKNKTPLKKWYRCLCKQTPLWKNFLREINKKWLPYLIQETVIAKVPHTTPKLWITQIESIEEKNYSNVFLHLQIFTWRTHQIRYHLSNHGLPIVWDYLYWDDKKWPLQLTAYKLEFLDCNQKLINIEIP